MTTSKLRIAVRDTFLIVVGSLIFAIGVDCFEIPYGLAAGGVTGLATVFYAMAEKIGVFLPVGMQTIVMNVPTTIASDDLLLCALWGGIITGIGLGLVFRSGGNTGGTDILAQIVAKHFSMPVGTAVTIVDGLIIAFSATVFSIEQALYAAVAMFICGKIIDAVVDGPRTERVAYIISEKHAQIASQILYALNRGCTELQARGVWSGNERPVLFCVLGRSELVQLKQIVSECDPEAIVVISEVHEVFGEGFKQIAGKS